MHFKPVLNEDTELLIVIIFLSTDTPFKAFALVTFYSTHTTEQETYR